MRIYLKLTILAFALLWGTSPAEADIKVYTHTVKQAFGGSQSPDDARMAAIAKAKREVLELAGTYIESMTIVKNNMIEEDQIVGLAAGVLNAEIVSQKNYATEEGFGILVTAKVAVDTTILEDRVETLIQDKELLEKNQEAQDRIEELLAKITMLEQENKKLKSVPDPGKQKSLEKEFKELGNGLEAAELLQKALANFNRGKFSEPEEAMVLLNRSIALDPFNDKSYALRAMAYRQQNEIDKAISDSNKAIELNPRNVRAYTFRGFIYRNMGNFRQALKDCNTAIRLNPNFARAYQVRGSIYMRLRKKSMACSDFRKACALGDCGALKKAQQRIDCQ